MPRVEVLQLVYSFCKGYLKADQSMELVRTST